jgi:hypothetical protein
MPNALSHRAARRPVPCPSLRATSSDGADYLVESDGHRWSLAAKTPTAPADATITATTQALTAFIFTGSDRGIDITGETEPVQRFRQLIGTMATVVQPV